VARHTGIRDFQSFRGRGGNELKRVGSDVDVGYGLFDPGHVAAHALIPGVPAL
jgi:hypothetical protein